MTGALTGEVTIADVREQLSSAGRTRVLYRVQVLFDDGDTPTAAFGETRTFTTARRAGAWARRQVRAGKPPLEVGGGSAGRWYALTERGVYHDDWWDFAWETDDSFPACAYYPPGP